MSRYSFIKSCIGAVTKKERAVLRVVLGKRFGKTVLNTIGIAVPAEYQVWVSVAAQKQNH